MFLLLWFEQKRGRPPKQRPKENDAAEQAERESSPDDFEEPRPRPKRNRAHEGTSSMAAKLAEQTLIGKLNTLLYFPYSSISRIFRVWNELSCYFSMFVITVDLLVLL